VFRIRDSLVPDPPPDPALFVCALQDANKFFSFSAYYFLKVHFHHSSQMKTKVIKKPHKVKIKSYGTFLLDDGRIWIP
jgi:hypothetical protein